MCVCLRGVEFNLGQSAVRYGEERARAETARIRTRTPKGLPRVPLDLRALSNTAR